MGIAMVLMLTKDGGSNAHLEKVEDLSLIGKADVYRRFVRISVDLTRFRELLLVRSVHFLTVDDHSDRWRFQGLRSS
jgi:hypothetical protein